MKFIFKIFLWVIGGFLSVSIASAVINPISQESVAESSFTSGIKEVDQEEGNAVLAEPIAVENLDFDSEETETVVKSAEPATSTVKSNSVSASTNSVVDTYVNVDGNTVQSPAYFDSAPSSASAQCRDGTYSFSQHRSGTCSGHGGVSEWL